MSEQGVQLIFMTVLVSAMFGVIKNIFAPADNDRLKRALTEGAFLVDVRTPAEFQAGSAKGAVNIPLDEIPRRLSLFRNKKTIIVFCRSGNRSGQAKRMLGKNGFRDVINGGTWQNVNKAISE